MLAPRLRPKCAHQRRLYVLSSPSAHRSWDSGPVWRYRAFVATARPKRRSQQRALAGARMRVVCTGFAAGWAGLRQAAFKVGTVACKMLRLLVQLFQKQSFGLAQTLGPHFMIYRAPSGTICPSRNRSMASDSSLPWSKEPLWPSLLTHIEGQAAEGAMFARRQARGPCSSWWYTGSSFKSLWSRP